MRLATSTHCIRLLLKDLASAIPMPTHGVPLKLVSAFGIGLFLFGFVLFLHSLGSGGGVGAISLMLIGATSLITAVAIGIVRIFQAKRRRAAQ